MDIVKVILIVSGIVLWAFIGLGLVITVLDRLADRAAYLQGHDDGYKKGCAEHSRKLEQPTKP